MKLTIHGTGYVGLVTGACLADIGHEVICYDTDSDKIQKLNQGIIPIYEPGLEKLVRDNSLKGNIQFSNNILESINHSNVQFIAVGTPADEDGSADIESVKEVARSIASRMKGYKLIVTKSTVPVGSGEKLKLLIQDILDKENKEINFDVASNPEFLKEGSAINDFMKPDRIVLGIQNKESESILNQIYSPFVKRSYRIISTSIESAELSKYAANAMLATRISFMNELSRLSEKVNADIEEVREIIGKDKRIGESFLYSGLGYGGSCFPKDLKALNRIAIDKEIDLEVLQSVMRVNDSQKIFFFNKIKNKFDSNLTNKTFAFWGLSFKPETDDIRQSPSIDIIEKLLNEGAFVRAFDPAVDPAKLELGENFSYFDNQYTALENADALVIATEWKSFWQPDFNKIAALLKNKIVFDGRNIYDTKNLFDQGFDYESIGR